MAKSRGLGQIYTDLERQLNAAFNELIVETVNELSSTTSPVDTGFFASSWKASTQRPQAKDEKTEPWSTYDRGSNKKTIKPRHPIPEFNYKKQSTVYVGNTAVYALQAFASPKSKIPQFVQGEIGNKIRSAFQEKRAGRIFVQTGQRMVAPVGYEQLGG
tara:strand:- start:127 stop:603 length:477 start_codon:yes stop_codon:yes gene_type:complete